MTSFTTALQVAEPSPGDPTTADTWGTTLNTGMTQWDAAIAGQVSVNCAGSGNITLSNTQGAVNQSSYAVIKCTGVLTGNIYVFMPNGFTRRFVGWNATTGSFTLTFAVNNGGSPAGTTVAVDQGTRQSLISDGTDIAVANPGNSGPAGGDLSGTYPNPTVTTTHLSAPLPIAQGGTAAITASAARTSLGLGTAAVLDTGTTANHVVELDGSAKLPAVDGSALTGITASQVSGVVVPGAVTNFTKQQYFGTATLTDGATISWDCDNQVVKVTLGGNRTMAAPTNMKNGGVYLMRVYQDATGSRTITWNAVFRWPSGTAPTLTTTASRMDILTFTSDGTNMYGVEGGANYTVT